VECGRQHGREQRQIGARRHKEEAMRMEREGLQRMSARMSRAPAARSRLCPNPHAIFSWPSSCLGVFVSWCSSERTRSRSVSDGRERSSGVSRRRQYGASASGRSLHALGRPWRKPDWRGHQALLCASPAPSSAAFLRVRRVEHEDTKAQRHKEEGIRTGLEGMPMVHARPSRAPEASSRLRPNPRSVFSWPSSCLRVFESWCSPAGTSRMATCEERGL